MKRKTMGTVELVWAQHKSAYELRKEGDEDNPDCIARVWGPEDGFTDDEFHYAIFSPHNSDRKEGPRACELKGDVSTFEVAVQMAEVSVDNKSWWRGRSLVFDRSALQEKFVRQEVQKAVRKQMRKIERRKL